MLGALAYDQRNDDYTVGQRNIMLIIRLGIMSPIAAFLILFTRSHMFLKLARYVFIPAILVVGACMVIYTSMQLHSKGERYNQPYGIYMMFMVYVFNYLPIRSCQAALVSLIVCVSFFVVLVLNNVSSDVRSTHFT